MPLKIEDSKFVPLSLCSSNGVPNLHTKLSTKAVVMVVDSWSGIGMASVHFVKQSHIVRIYLFLRVDVGNGPKTSISTLSKGSPMM